MVLARSPSGLPVSSPQVRALWGKLERRLRPRAPHAEDDSSYITRCSRVTLRGDESVASGAAYTERGSNGGERA